MKSTKDAAPCLIQTAYKLGNVTYVPHYRVSGVYVGPGYPRLNRNIFSAQELVDAGAIAVSELLWARSNYGVINLANP